MGILKNFIVLLTIGVNASNHIKCVGSCNTLKVCDKVSNKVCVPNKTGDLNIHVFKYDYRKN